MTEATLAAAERVAELLRAAGIEAALIGAAALAAHGYPRSTDDLDLATGVEPQRLDAVAGELRREGFAVELTEPDGDDPLGGVMRVVRDGIDPIEVVNFCNPPAGGNPALAAMALRDATPVREGASLRVVTLAHLVVFKLYAGGRGDKNDVLELLSRNPEADLNALRELCRRFGLDRRFEAWLGELRPTDGA